MNKQPVPVPVVIDVEASGLGRGSYPIEVGVALADGSAESMIIRPEPDWLHWDITAESLHGIKREVLTHHGRPITEVARRLNEMLAGEVVYTDAWGNDQSWLALLFFAANTIARFRLEPLRSLMSEHQLGCWHDTKQAIEQELDLRRHRASTDAKILQATYLRTLTEAGPGAS